MNFQTNEPKPFASVTTAEYDAWFPKDRPIDKPELFELGLVLAGAISAGAYTAGVMDFLFQALDAWHAAKAAGEDVPMHEVKLKIMTGASAGGMNAAIAAVACRKDFPHITEEHHNRDGEKNPFYKAWVKSIDIENLLTTDDLKEGQPVGSLLNCQSLDAIIKDVLEFQGSASQASRRAWLDDPFQVVLTLTNLSGVPYGVRFSGQTKLYHEMVLHRDDIRFGVPVLKEIAKGAVSPDVIPLGCAASPEDSGWNSLGVSALATGAFPLALAPRQIERQRTDYEYRYAYMNSKGEHIYAQPWPSGAKDTHKFYSVDGGAMNNEPFEIARSFLSGSAGKNPREGNKSQRAIVMIDPFSDAGAPFDMPEASLPAIVKRLFAAYKQQSRFNQIDLSLAEAGDVYSRFLVAPSRGSKRGQEAIASGGLGGFLGFFGEDLRRHDFLLGRANCQRFLRDWFVLPVGAEGNPIFNAAATSQNARDNPAFRSLSKDRADHMQIIPLVGGLDKNLPLPCWSGMKCKGYADLEVAIENRVDRVYKGVRDGMTKDLSFTKRLIARTYLWPAWKFYLRSKLLDTAKTAINDAIEALKKG
ncbi:MAG TPA: patatin-like phospholipase family protein [Thermohalobaculum sp.]|nr:patatin-like phospholipase family protein [Thermohalobaculum sp.]